MLTRGQRCIKHLSDVSSFLSHTLVAREKKSLGTPNNKVKTANTKTKAFDRLQKVNFLTNHKFRGQKKMPGQAMMMRVIKITQILSQTSAEFSLIMRNRKELSTGRNLAEELNFRRRTRYVCFLGSKIRPIKIGIEGMGRKIHRSRI